MRIKAKRRLLKCREQREQRKAHHEAGEASRVRPQKGTGSAEGMAVGHGQYIEPGPRG